MLWGLHHKHTIYNPEAGVIECERENIHYFFNLFLSVQKDCAVG